jgi:histidyl-tRNA synthetase
VDAFIGYMSEEEQPLALEGTRCLREAGRSVDLQLKPMKPKKLFSAAAKAQARFAVFVGPAEREEGILVVKNLETGEQKKIPPLQLEKEF